MCLNGYHDMRHQYDMYFYGCKHILLEDYDIIRDEIMPRKYYISFENLNQPANTIMYFKKLLLKQSSSK